LTSKPKPQAKARAPKRRPRPLVDKREAFLAAFRLTCSLTEAAEIADCNRSSHYAWMNEPEYKKAFEAIVPAAGDQIQDDMVQWARKGVFEPAIYMGQFCYEKRQRVMCKMADGTTAFEDELPKKHQPIIDRKTVVTKDGPQIGVWKRDAGLLAKLATAWIPAMGNRLKLDGKIEITDPDDARQHLIRQLDGIEAQSAAQPGDIETK
jgi:hypothetical protein